MKCEWPSLYHLRLETGITHSVPFDCQYLNITTKRHTELAKRINRGMSRLLCIYFCKFYFTSLRFSHNCLIKCWTIFNRFLFLRRQILPLLASRSSQISSTGCMHSIKLSDDVIAIQQSQPYWIPQSIHWQHTSNQAATQTHSSFNGNVGRRLLPISIQSLPLAWHGSHWQESLYGRHRVSCRSLVGILLLHSWDLSVSQSVPGSDT